MGNPPGHGTAVIFPAIAFLIDDPVLPQVITERCLGMCVLLCLVLCLVEP